MAMSGLHEIRHASPKPAAIIAALERHRVIPVIRTSTAAFATAAVDALAAGGFTTFEITMTIPGALAVIEDLTATTELLVGAGTVLNLDQAADCLAAGARYLVSPCVIPDLPALCHGAHAACLLGGMTPTELRQAHIAGADAVKIFPAASVGGPRHVAALKAVFPDVRLVPTGGVTADNAGDYLRAGAAFVGIGGALIDEAALAAGDHTVVSRRARETLAAVQSA